MLSVSDCKMAALATRASVQAQEGYSLYPLAQIRLPAEELGQYLQPVWNSEQPLVAVQRARSKGEGGVIAQGCEQTMVCNGEVADQMVTWPERQVIVQSVKLAASKMSPGNRAGFSAFPPIVIVLSSVPFPASVLAVSASTRLPKIEGGIERPSVRNGRSVANLNTRTSVMVTLHVEVKATSINECVAVLLRRSLSTLRKQGRSLLVPIAAVFEGSRFL
jgi:hypothetical protein